MHAHTQEDSEINQIWLRTGKARWLSKGNPWRNTPNKWFKLLMTTRLPLCPPTCLSTRTVLSSCRALTSFTHFASFVGNLFCRAKGPGPCHFTSGQVRTQLSLNAISGWELKPCFKLLQAKEIILVYALQTFRILLHPVWIKILTTLLTCVWVDLKFYSCKA